MQRIYIGYDKWALVDDQDFDLCGMYSWRCTNGYAIAIERGTQKTVLLHKLIAERMGIVNIADHKDRDRLNCQRENLRESTYSQNGANASVSRNNKLGVKGVHWRKNSYTACITVNGKSIHLGNFNSVEEASAAYQNAANYYFGEFAST